jgi:long-subunit acyl-CoA synthetase (AMP-forming)
VVDDAGCVLGAGAQGHLQVRGDMLMSGYLDEDATARTMTADGWFRTGDLGLVTDEGWLEVTGRTSDQTLGRAGPMAPIEDAVRSACGVEDAAVQASTDGGALILYLQAAARQSIDQASAVAALKSVSGWTGLVDVRRLEVFPRTASGKIDRLRLGA